MSRREKAPAGFYAYRVSEYDLPPSRRAHVKADAIAYAKGVAKGQGYRVTDVSFATYQDDGDWLVELAVVPDGPKLRIGRRVVVARSSGRLLDVSVGTEGVLRELTTDGWAKIRENGGTWYGVEADRLDPLPPRDRL